MDGKKKHKSFRIKYTPVRNLFASKNCSDLLGKELKSFVQAYGDNSNSFLCLYPGFKVFEWQQQGHQGLIVYADTPFFWVGVSHPLGEPSQLAFLLKAFLDAALLQHKGVMLLPCSEALAQKAVTCGFHAFMIGVEPVFDLKVYEPSLKKIPAAFELFKKKYRVYEFTLDQLSDAEKKVFFAITDEWMKSRPTTLLQFVNTIDLFQCAAEKKYFRIDNERGVMIAFVAAVPIWPQKGWYFMDVMRKKLTPAGSIEALFLESMRLLKAKGYEQVTLGVSPLAGLQHDPQFSQFKILQWMDWVFHHVDFLYRFRTLYQFKCKFEPSFCAPSYIIFAPEQKPWKIIQGLSHVFIPQGLKKALWHTWKHQLQLQGWIQPLIASDMVVRTFSPSFLECFFHSPCVLALIGVNGIFFFLMSLLGPSFFQMVIDDYGFSLQAFDFPYQLAQRIVLSSFLHMNLNHLMINILGMCTIGVFLENILGFFYVFMAYFLGQLLSNVITGAFLLWLSDGGTVLLETKWMDIGASLGVWGCWGALLFCFKKRVLWLLASLGGLTGVIFWSYPFVYFLDFNHACAMLIGFGWMSLSRFQMGVFKCDA